MHASLLRSFISQGSGIPMHIQIKEGRDKPWSKCEPFKLIPACDSMKRTVVFVATKRAWWHPTCLLNSQNRSETKPEIYLQENFIPQLE